MAPDPTPTESDPPTPPSSRTLWALVGAALLAALIVAAPIVVAARGVRPPSTLAAAEPSAWSAAHAHADTAKNLAADRTLARRCARTAYRAHHPARCPAATARPGTQRATDGGDATSMGRWAAPFAVPTWAIHAVLLPTGKVLWLSKRQDESAGGDAHLYDPATGTITQVTPPSVRYPDGSVKPANLFCAGQALLPDGRVLVAGGNLAYYQSDAPGQSWKGARWLFTFDPWTETWTRQTTDMAKGRWYPTVTTLPDGRALISGGWDESGNDVSDDDLEVFTPSPRMNGADGTVTKVGTRPWAQLYPHMFVIPDTTAAGAGSAKVLMAGPMGRYPANAGILDTATWKWTSIPYLPTNREFGGAVMLPGGTGGPTKVLLTGGSDAPFDTTPTATTAVLDLNAVGAGFQPGPPLLTARTHGNVVALPDGSVMEVGGGGGTSDPTDGSIYDAPVYRSELLDPGASAFRAADVQSEARTYHATALLLPDGRVLSAGDDRASHATNRTAELYSPPYLFRGARPRITFAPSAARYDAPIRVGTPDPGAIARAVLVRPSSVTHVTDMDARSLTLALTAERGGLTLRTPRNGTVAPPGWYMLFLLDRNGVPSVASWIRLDPSAPDAPEIPGGGGAAAPTGTAAGPGGGDLTTTGSPTRPRDRVAPRVTLAVAAPSHAANGTLTAVVRVRSDERAGLVVRVALGHRVVERTLRGAPGGWATATVRFGHAPRHAFLHVRVRAADAARNVRTAVRTVRF